LTSANAVAFGKTYAEERRAIRSEVDDTLAMLFERSPEARTFIEQNAGYAVFSNVGLKVLLLGGAWGNGIAFNNVSGEETFMKMREIHAGLGWNFRKVRLVFVFETGEGFHAFLNGDWRLAPHAAAKANVTRAIEIADRIEVSPGVWLYQIIDDALSLELTVKSTRYCINDKLNVSSFY